MSNTAHHTFEAPEQLHAWLQANHASKTELWVRIFKKATGQPSVTWDDCVVAAIAWGWIDGIRKSLDDTSFLQRLTPRRARSNWSQKNVQLAERLIAQGRMQAAGLAHVDAARSEGLWATAYAGSATMPAEQLAAVSADLLPGILKTARMGYDGKGQVRVKTLEELAQAWDELGRVACVLEKMLPLAHECSVIVARGRDGQIVNLPVQRNLHRDGILAVTEVYEGNLPLAQAQQALEAAKSVAEGLQYVGVLCVEFFVLQDGALVVNEIAPRPHNSGHYSQNGCDVSQFELQVRCMTGLPLVQPRLHSASIMLNLLGDLWFTHGDTAQTPAWDQVLALPGCHLHLYGKAQAQRGRKMGHLNITATTAEAARATALQAAAIVGIEAF